MSQHGLRLRGGFIPTPDDRLPVLHGGAAAAVVWMVGQVGSECWSAFACSRFFSDGQADPLDRWSQSIGNALAQRYGGLAVYPSDGPPYAPFQQWAARAEPVQPSPLLLQLHPQWGLWHAYRFALLLPEVQVNEVDRLFSLVDASDSRPMVTAICSQCADQPCLSACPVDAFRAGRYEAGTCASHLHGPTGAECMQGGCLARRACPVAPDLKYAPAHAAFHMQAFSHRR